MTDCCAIHAVAGSSPLYRNEFGMWHAFSLPNRGPVSLSPGAKPALAVGRHVYVLRNGAWKRLRSARAKRLTALWLEDDRQLWAADNKRRLLSYSRGKWTTRRLKLAADDQVRSLTRVGTELFVLTRAGAVLRVRGTTATPLSTPADMSDVVVAAAAVGAGKLILVGRSEARAVVLAVDGDALVVREDLPNPKPSAAVLMLHADSQGDVLLSTDDGLLWVRKSGKWMQGTLVHEPPGGVVTPRAGARPAIIR